MVFRQFSTHGRTKEDEADEEQERMKQKRMNTGADEPNEGRRPISFISHQQLLSGNQTALSKQTGCVSIFLLRYFFSRYVSSIFYVAIDSVFFSTVP